MTIQAGRRALLGVVLAIGLAVTLPATTPTSRADAAGLPAWTGGVSLYRNGSFTTQRSWLWCTAAGVQIVRNMVDHKTDHTTAGQRRYFDWMRGRNRYDLPLSAGIDPAGWTAGLRHFVDDRYRLVASKSFDAALRSAVTRLRLTNLPVALTVSHGNHGWILNGFRATADPAMTSRFTVTSVRVTGPLYGLQSKNGYDMPPNTKLTTAQLKRFFTPWKYAPKRMVWDGLYVSIQPIPKTSKPAATVKAPARTIAPTTPTAAPAAIASGVVGDGRIGVRSASPVAPTRDDSDPVEVAVAAPVDRASPSPANADPPGLVPASDIGSETFAWALAAVSLAVVLGAAVAVKRGRPPRSG